LDRAIKASVAEAASGRPRAPTDGTLSPSDSEFNTILEKSIQDSLHKSQHVEDLNSHTEIDDDESVKLAIEASKITHEEHLSRVRTEEEIVMEYVKRQSLAEEEYEKALQKKPNRALSDAEDGSLEYDSGLKRALEESLKTSSAGNS
jgi:hypothetical protein